jgi:hypothetical protein
MIKYSHKWKQKREAISVVKFAKRNNSTSNKRFIQKWLVGLRTGLRHPIKSLKVFYRQHRYISWGFALLTVVVLCLASVFVYMRLQATNYDITAFEGALLDEPIDLYGERLVFDEEREKYVYNDNYLANVDAAGQVFAPKVSAHFYDNPSDGVEVVDPINDVTIGLKPLFRSGSPQKNSNRVVYPLPGNKATKIYTLKANSIKEDIILHEYQGSEMSFDYELDLPDGVEARLETDGSVGIYGVDNIFLGDVATGSEEDEQLLEQARENGERTELLFHLPAPFVIEENKRRSEANAWFTLDGDRLTLHADSLDEGNYPLSIDPSVYVESAMQFMRGNNETNVYFDVDYDLIRKAGFTGASFDSWSPTLELNQGIWGAGAVAAGGYVYSVGGNDGSSNISNVYWSRLNTVNYTMTSPNPGDGACTNWCTNAAYDLPEALTGLSLVAYNGYLYAIGGENDLGERSDHVYIAKLGNNGEPRLWHPTSTDESEWVYWYRDTDTDLSVERSYHASVAYDNRIYIIGGQTDPDPDGVSLVEYADINPDGTFGDWSTEDMTTLPVGAGKHHHSVEVYNDRLYVVGGVEGSVSTGNILDNVFYAKIENGSLGDWTQTSSLSSPRMTWGGSFSAIWGGYIYQVGGCSAVNEEDPGEGVPEGMYCTDIEEAAQFASITASGSLSSWINVSGGSAQYIGHNLTSWNGALYRIGGCSGQDDTTGDCAAAHDEVDYALINTAGEVSSLRVSSPSGDGTCDGSEPYDCDLPPLGNSAGEGGQLLTASAMVNGYLYVIGGCVDTGCSDASGNVSYAEIADDGTLSRPETCGDSYYGAWCVDNTNQINGANGVAAAAVATFGDTVYVVGGLDGTANTNTIFRNTIADDGSLEGSWSSQSLSGAGATSVSHTFAYARANPSAVTTAPGHLYIFGGCEESSGADCINDSYSTEVSRCDIQTDGTIANCTTTSQLQIDSDSSSGGEQGLGLHAGTVYANYVYLVGGYSQTQSDKDTVLYAQIDNNNNVVAVDGTDWAEVTATLSTGQAAGHAFGYNGYLYAVGGFNSGENEVLDRVEFAKINTDDGSLESFFTSSTTIDQRWGLAVAVSNSNAYMLGGCSSGVGTGSCTSLEPSVRTIKVHNNDSGAPKSYDAANNLFSTDRIAASTAVHDGYIYIAGGCTDSVTCGIVTDDVQYASLDPSGNVGGWSTVTAVLPNERAWGQLEVAGGTLYYIGGQDENAVVSTEVYYATPSSGDISAWSTTTNGLPSPRAQHSTAVWDDRIYVVGGKDDTETPHDTVYVSPQLSSGGDIDASWSTSTSFDLARSGHTTTAYGNTLYVIGGYNDGSYLSDVQFARINSDGTVGDWSYSSSLPLPLSQGDGFAANGYIYMFGGRSGDEVEQCQNRTFVAPISANTSIVEGNDPTGLGDWFESSSRFGGRRFGVSASHYEGRAYLLGGGCAGLIAQFDEYNTAGEHTFTAPEDTTQVIIEAWGGGGGGGGGEDGGDNAAGAGGGGGGYARHTLPVSSGNYTLWVGGGGSPGISAGAAGGDGEGSWFDSDSTVYAAGGSGAGWGTASGPGGIANIGSDATYDGGSGGTGWAQAQPVNRRGGGGGGSAFFNAHGGDGQDGTSQAGSGIGGSGTGNGGDGGVNTSDGGSGGTPGAGGGGGGTRGGDGGPGATGRVIVHYQEWSELVLSGSDRVSVGTLLTQPQVARYSYAIDADTDVLPTHWLLNGFDNPLEARWSLSHRSATFANASWGQETSYDEATLGQPEVYEPLDETGTNTTFARFYDFVLEIDNSLAYGFPDDASRGATVTDLTLFFTSNPGQRLRHGKTFTGGEQQSFDTPF